MSTVAKAPSKCSEEEKKIFFQLVKSGGEVVLDGLEDRIRTAEMLVFHYDGNKLLGVAALKTPSSSRRNGVFQKSQANLPEDTFPFELGWVVVTLQYRGKGLSRCLVETALQAADGQNVFAVSRVDNAFMHKTLERYGFTREGRSYLSRRSTHDLQLFVRLVTQPCI